MGVYVCKCLNKCKDIDNNYLIINLSINRMILNK